MEYEYAVVIEWSEENYGVYVPDLPGCVSVGDTVEEATQNIREAMAFHLRTMREDGDPIPPARTVVTTVAVNLSQAVSVS